MLCVCPLSPGGSVISGERWGGGSSLDESSDMSISTSSVTVWPVGASRACRREQRPRHWVASGNVMSQCGPMRSLISACFSLAWKRIQELHAQSHGHTRGHILDVGIANTNQQTARVRVRDMWGWQGAKTNPESTRWDGRRGKMKVKLTLSLSVFRMSRPRRRHRKEYRGTGSPGCL